MTAESPMRTMIVAGSIALVCALAVATVQVQLRPQIQANIAAERAARMAVMLNAIPGLAALVGDRGIAALEPLLIDLASGDPASGDPLSFDPISAAEDPETGRALATEADIAGLKRVANSGVVYLIRDESGKLALVILPVRARGYQSVIRAMLALEPDLVTVAALNIIEQGETPGLGARVQSPAWQALWPGRSLVDETGALAITVVRGKGTEPFQVDGLTGATRSSQAVGNAVQFWLGADGYGPFLDLLALQEGLK